MKFFKFFFLICCLIFIEIGNAHAQQFYCPGQNVELSCREPNGVIWQGSSLSGQCPPDNMITVVGTEVVVGNTSTCGSFTSNVTDLSSGALGATIVTASLIFVADVAMNGTRVQCEDADPDSPLQIDLLLDIPATITPTLMLSQNSQSMVGVMFMLDDTRCVSNYTVNVTRQEDGNTTILTEASSPVIVENLDLCQYNYSFVGYTTSVITTERSGVSTPVDLMVNLTVLDNLMVTLNTMDPLIQWTHDISLYPSCITGYRIASNGLNVTVGPSIRSLNGTQLIETGFLYCTTLHPTVTPLTPDHLPDLSPVMGSNSIYVPLINPDFPMPILSYMFTLNRSSADDSNINDNNMTNSSINESNMNTGVTELVRLRISIEDPGRDVDTTSYSYTFNGSMPSSTPFNDSFFYIDLPGAEGGDVVSVTVIFETGPCMSSRTVNYTVPEKNITGVRLEGQTEETSATVSIILPLTVYQPEELLIISTVDPADIGLILDNYTRPAQQYAVTFTGLDTDTSYTFTIRIVLRSNTTANVVLPATGMFMTLATTPPPIDPSTTSSDTTPRPTGTSAPSSNVATIVGIIVAILVVIAILIVVAVIVLVCWWSKSKKSASVTISSDHEMGTKLTGNNGDGAASKPETPTPDSIENPDVILAKSEPEPATTASDSAALIYADLDIGKNKPKPSSGGASATSPTGSASGGQEDVQYADINFVKSTTAEEN